MSATRIFEGVEELFLALPLVAEKLDVVDQQDVHITSVDGGNQGTFRKR